MPQSVNTNTNYIYHTFIFWQLLNAYTIIHKNIKNTILWIWQFDIYLLKSIKLQHLQRYKEMLKAP